MKSVIVIPARFHSTRLPGKPLALIHGKSLLHRTWSIAKAIKQVDAVYVATDDQRIQQHATAFGAEVVMTRESCENGTVRTYEAIQQAGIFPEIIINLQGDAVLTAPWVIQSLLDEMIADQTVAMATLATQMNQQQLKDLLEAKQRGEVGGTTVVFDLKYNALYFSKSVIPFQRDKTQHQSRTYRHIGLYGFRYDTLKKYIHLEPTVLEQTEGLEQLRALVHGIAIKIVVVDYRGRTHWAVDSLQDIKMAETIIANEGELL